MKIKKSYQTSLIWIISFCLFTYIILRAYYLSFTHDESLSYSILIGDATWIETANNHIFNTYLMDCCFRLFGDTEFSLRLPNVLAFGLYLYSCFTVFKKFNNIWLLLLGSSILLFNPFIIDFFSLARGYGLSLAFMMMSILFLLKINFNNPTYKDFMIHLVLSLFFSSLSVYSNLGMINYHIAILAIWIFQYVLFLKEYSESSIKMKIIFIFIFLMAIDPIFNGIKRLLLLSKNKQLYFGEDSITSSLDSLISNSLYFSKHALWIIILIKYIIIFFLTAGFILMILKRDFQKRSIILTILNSIIIIGLILEHYLFGSKYPSGRTGLFLIPIFGLLICFLVSDLFQYFPTKKIFWMAIIPFISVPLIIHFFGNINLKYTKTWQYDAHTKDAMKITKTSTDSLSYKTPIINYWLFEPTINYYINSKKINIYTNNRGPQNLNSSFVYELDSNVKSNNYRVLCKYNDIHAILLMKNEIGKK